MTVRIENCFFSPAAGSAVRAEAGDKVVIVGCTFVRPAYVPPLFRRPRLARFAPIVARFYALRSYAEWLR